LVKVGQEWDVPVPKNPMMEKDQILKAKLVGEREVDGVKVWVVTIAGPMEMNADLSKMMADAPDNPAAGMKMLMSGTIQVSGENLIEQGSGRLVLSTQKADSKMKMELPDMGMSIDMTGTTTSKMALKK
jgi:hypothetical protein